MDEALKGVWRHMMDLGLGALAHANRHAAYAAMGNGKWPDLSVLQAAHAAELLIKARIAQEHPLLIFEELPKSTAGNTSLLEMEDLFRKGTTIQWSDLPHRLWATTGLVIPNRAQFDAFGKLRNGIQHFAPPTGVNSALETLRFVFEVIDPFINECWGLFAIDYDEDYDPYIYFVSTLAHQNILFLVSSEAADRFDEWDIDWESVPAAYKTEMHARVERACAPA